MIRILAAVLCCSYFCSYALGIPVADFFQAITVKNCGTSIFPPSSPDKIVGGTDVEAGQYPWIVSLRNGFAPICGASVLNEDWVITAAHCIDDNPTNYRILVGLHKLSNSAAETVQTVEIAKIVVHKDYNDVTYENDIALLKTVKPIDIAGSKGYVNGICLPETNKDPTGYARVIGWGHTYQYGVLSDTLQEVVLPLVSRDQCNDAYKNNPDYGVNGIKKTMICAGMANKDSCQYDSGGPLFQTDSRGVSTLIGVVSHGGGCGLKDHPGVYTKVAPYLTWMQEVIVNQM